MATYNGSAYLEPQLRSLAEQTCLPDELVVSDDASTDDTRDVIERFAQTAPFPVRMFRNEHTRGYVQNFGSALAQTRGAVIFLADQDDVWLPGKIEAVHAVFCEREDVSIVVHDEVLADEDLRHSGLTRFEHFRRLGKKPSDLVAGCCTAMVGELLPLLLPIPATYPTHDDWIHAMGPAMGTRVVVEEPWILHRRHGHNASNSLTSSSTIISPKLRERYRFLLAGSPKLRREATLLRIEIARLREFDETRQMNGSRFASFVSAKVARLDAIESRLSVLRDLGLARLQSGIQLYRRGGYRHFSGAKSLVRDLLLPQGWEEKK